LLERRGAVFVNVRPLLEALAERADVANLLLTGNMRAGALAKLTSYGLVQFFDTGGFGDDGYDRPPIARAAIARAEALYGRADAAGGVLIGDTPLDIACGIDVGLRTLGVCTGTYNADELSAAGATWVVECLPSADELIAMTDHQRAVQ
jgi:phosphoglycolate phosphatase-like HAD superfamily hydrolase